MVVLADYLRATAPALRDQGKAWGAYELNHALVLALDRPDAQTAWKQEEDPLADAAADPELLLNSSQHSTLVH